jgi:hypothetical protein
MTDTDDGGTQVEHLLLLCDDMLKVLRGLEADGFLTPPELKLVRSASLIVELFKDESGCRESRPT